ncbi:MAG: hypothetical protein IJY52_00500 [Anaerotignum sp.]|nr:hypothetical protein [Anaerotignum sp.]
MSDHNWINELRRRAQTDEWYQSWAQTVRESEMNYLAIRDSLPEEQQEILDAYVSDCKSMQNALLPLAYEIGMKHGLVKAKQK